MANLGRNKTKTRNGIRSDSLALHRKNNAKQRAEKDNSGVSDPRLLSKGTTLRRGFFKNESSENMQSMPHILADAELEKGGGVTNSLHGPSVPIS